MEARVSGEELREFVRTSLWTFARTMPHIPHEYTLRAKAPDQNLFERVVLYIRQAGYKGTFGSATGSTGRWERCWRIPP